MGYRDYPTPKKTSFWSDNNALLILIIINVLVFISLHFIKTIYGLSSIQQESFFKNVYSWFTMPADFGKLAERPWTLVTAMFTQLSPILLLSNLFWLWTFGYILQDLAGNRKVIPLFIYGGLTGAVVFLLAFNMIPQLSSYVGEETFFGSGASVMTIAVATTMISPNYRLFPMIGNGIPIWIITLIFMLVDFTWLSTQPGWFFPHLGSAFMGLIYVKALRKGHDWTNWMNNFYDWLLNLFNPYKPRKRKRGPVRQEVFYNTKGQKPFRKTTNLTQQKIDEILDKISLKGFDRLSDEEKDLLRRASEEDL